MARAFAMHFGLTVACVLDYDDISMLYCTL